jgi:hypothetical protein
MTNIKPPGLMPFCGKHELKISYTQLRFAHMFQEFEEPDWLQNGGKHLVYIL